MELVFRLLLLLSATLWISATAEQSPEPLHQHRKAREIRKTTREGRLVYQTSEESLYPRKGLIVHNRPSEPLYDLYRKGFSNLHVPDFHRQAVEERVPQYGESNQSIDDIISGIIHLLGGDVQVTRPESRLPPGKFTSSPRPTRINNRGPAGFDMYANRNLSVLDSTRTSFEVEPLNTSVNSSSSIYDNKMSGVTKVSVILGLFNQTSQPSSNAAEVNSTVFNDPTTFIGGIRNISSGDLKIVEIISSRESENSFGLTSFSLNSNSHFTSEIRPTGVLTEMDTNGYAMLETIISNSLNNHSKETVDSIQPDESSSYSKVLINYTELPIIIPSRNIIFSNSSTTNQGSPSGPITEWLPISKPSERRPNSTGTYTPESQEPVIITRPPVEGPDTFEITITRQMYDNQSNSKMAIPTFTSLITPTEVISSTDISVSIVSSQVDVIYGRPSISVPPTGRPQVYPVDIAEVRPGPNIYQRFPRPPPPPDYELQKYTNGLRPAQMARPGSVPVVRKPPTFRPLPEIRIDTCVVGDDSTCDVQLKEHCRTERGVSSCLCRPGYGRTIERTPCSPVVSMLLTLKVAKLADKNIDSSHFVPGSAEYLRLNFEASHAVTTLFGFSPLSEAYRGAVVNRIYFIANRMVINSTVHLAEAEVRGSLRHHVEHAVATAISRRENRLGTSQLYINGPLSALLEVEDLNECKDHILNDCSEYAKCDNLFGSFQCKCKPGYTDKLQGDPKNEGRICSACSPDYCNGKGQCLVVQGRQECRCRGNYGGSRCQVDNEVVGVSVGVSVIAIIVIAITAACLYLWNRRWKKAHQKSEAAKHAGYRLQTMADHVRWGPTSPIGSTYVPSESTMAPPALSTSACQLYAISTLQPPRQRTQLYEEDINPYGRIIRTLQKRNSLNGGGGGLHYDTLNSECPSSEEIGFPSVPSNSFVYHGTAFQNRSNVYR